MFERYGACLKRLRCVLAMPFLIAFLLSDAQTVIGADVERWAKIEGRSRDQRQALVELAAERKEFRNLFYHRVSHGNRAGKLAGKACLSLLPAEPTLRLNSDEIGPGLYLQHAFATTVGAERIGANVWINQQVTIGVRIGEDGHDARPVLEDGATVCSGAIVIGDVRIGRGAVVGAGAVVTHDVPDGMVAVGPAATVREFGEEVSRRVDPLAGLEETPPT
jgi:serine O-acetyltransferase